MMRRLLVIFLITITLFSCTYKPVQVTDLQWVTPALLSKEGCLDIDGKYQDRGLLERRLSDLALSDDQRQRLGLPPLSIGTYTEYRKTPFGQRLPAKEAYARQAIFDKEAITSIKRRGRTYEVILMNHGLEYSKTVIKLDHPQLGCFNGALVIKEITSFGPGESGCGTGSTYESEYRKLSDGTLEITYHSRVWPCSIHDDNPKITQGKLLFPPAQ